MSNPSWNDAPEWAKWLTVDGRGLLNWDEFKPRWNWLSERWVKGKGRRQEGVADMTGGKHFIQPRP